jgi:hypothetical protein
MTVVFNTNNAYVYAMEISTKQHSSKVLNIILISDYLPSIVTPLIFKYISARWQIIIVIGLTCKLVCLFMLPWIYESPKYLKS